MKIVQKTLALFLSCSLLSMVPGGLTYAQTPTEQAAPQSPANGQAPPAPAKQSPEELQQLVAPIALYPDALIAQILAAATYPTEIVEADRWMQEHSNLKGKDLGDQVDKQPWDPSVKALTQFASVLANMDKNLSWTSSLGDAYANQPNDVMDAVQVMRSRAQKSGNLKSNQQEKVENQGQTIVIEPANPEVVYVPAYDPWLVYGAPVVMWPGWYGYPGLYIGGPGISFGLGFGIGFFGGFGWGWHHWGADWGHRSVMYNHNTYISHSTTIINRNNFNRTTNNFNHNNFNHNTNNFNHNNFNHGQAGAQHGFGGAQHGFSGQSGMHSGAFSGFNHGGVSRGFSARGQSSFHGGGGFHGGGHGR
jgi:Protein of unknown function (DUF3300)